MLKSTYVYSDTTSTFPIHKGLYIHNLMNDEFYTIEEGVGTYIWSQMDGSKSIEQIITEIARLCRKDKHMIQQDILDFVSILIEKKLIVKV